MTPTKYFLKEQEKRSFDFLKEVLACPLNDFLRDIYPAIEQYENHLGEGRDIRREMEKLHKALSLSPEAIYALAGRMYFDELLTRCLSEDSQTLWAKRTEELKNTLHLMKKNTDPAIQKRSRGAPVDFWADTLIYKIRFEYIINAKEEHRYIPNNYVYNHPFFFLIEKVFSFEGGKTKRYTPDALRKKIFKISIDKRPK